MSTARLERAVTVPGLEGAELDTVVNGEKLGRAQALPLFKAAEAMGAVLFFHPQPQHNFHGGAHAAPRRVQQPGISAAATIASSTRLYNAMRQWRGFTERLVPPRGVAPVPEEIVLAGDHLGKAVSRRPRLLGHRDAHFHARV